MLHIPSIPRHKISILASPYVYKFKFKFKFKLFIDIKSIKWIIIKNDTKYTIQTYKASLGVTVSSDLRWNAHIANICKRANSTLSFLKRNINISNPKVKEKSYKALVRPTIEYACTTWDPYQQNNRHRLEMVQRQAARYVRNTYNTCYRNVTSTTVDIIRSP